MGGDEVPRAVFLMLLLVLVASSLAARRLPLKQTAKMALAWVAIFSVVVVGVAFQPELKDFISKVGSSISGSPAEPQIGPDGELRSPMRGDGHFWIKAEVNGRPTDFLVDSGASITTIDPDVAKSANVQAGLRVAQVETANGTVVMPRSEVRLVVGPIEREDFAVLLAEQDGLNVLGMNFLSSLRGWRAEGRTLVLQP
jgi:aspartyl protease family protein